MTIRTRLDNIVHLHPVAHCYFTEGLAMGAPTSTILAETYLQHMEHKHLYQILLKHKIAGYFRYVDDILIVYNQKKTNIDKTIIEFNKQKKNITFKIEKEHHKSKGANEHDWKETAIFLRTIINT
jgi:hypothetical protein